MNDIRHQYTRMHFANAMRGVCYDPATLFTTLLAKIGVSGALAAGGTILSTAGAIQQGNAANAAAEYNARQLEASAKTEKAAAQRQANEQTRQKELTLSRARTVAAASGGGQDVPLMGQIEEDGQLRALTALWEGDEAAAGRNAQAASARLEGKQAKRAGVVRGLTTLGEGGSSLYEKYW